MLVEREATERYNRRHYLEDDLKEKMSVENLLVESNIFPKKGNILCNKEMKAIQTEQENSRI